MAISTMDWTLVRGGLTSAGTINTAVNWLSSNGFDLVWRQNQLAGAMKEIEGEIAAIEADANLSDTERMFAMQMAMNTWSAISNLRTNMLKSVSDTLKAIVRNVA